MSSTTFSSSETRLASLNSQIQPRKSTCHPPPPPLPLITVMFNSAPPSSDTFLNAGLEQYRGNSSSSSSLSASAITDAMYGYNYHHMLEVFEVIRSNPETFRHGHLEEWDREKSRAMSFEMMRKYSAAIPFDYSQYKYDPHIATLLGLGIYQFLPSLCIKYGVHFYLYTKTLINLGTAKHQRYIDAACSLADIGSFSLTELGHGSNVKSILTTATYDAHTNQFIIHTPNDLAIKWWIGATAELAN